jgi:putative transposase
MTWTGSQNPKHGDLILKTVNSVPQPACFQLPITRAGPVLDSTAPDHIHMLLSAPPHLAPAKLVQYIKGRSSRKLQEEFPELRKRYWGQHLWARGYFCATVGAVDEQTIKAYIENQKWDEDDQGFKITAPTEP